MARVLVALSGGVDSAVAAALLIEHGHDVTAVHLKLADADPGQPGQGCCTLDDAQDARRVAQVLGVPFYVWDLSDVFAAAVEKPFAAAYAAGRTPNPCITCNEQVKYAALLDRAVRLGFEALATGHHVRLRRDDGPGGALTPVREPGGGARLFRAADPAKDQSYVLYVATPAQLARSLFPVGELTKDDVRAVARDRGLRVADKPDSYEICFVPGGDTRAYLGDRLPVRRGDVVDLDGTTVGQHDGVWRFTVGQRRGLGLGLHERRFVIDLDAAANRVVVGPREALACRWLDLGDVTWTTGRAPTGSVTVQVRAHGRPRRGWLEPRGSGAPVRGRIHLDEPCYGVAVGQAAVCYTLDGEECLGGGRIVAAERPALAS